MAAILLLLVAPESALERVAAVFGHLGARGMFIGGFHGSLVLWTRIEGDERGFYRAWPGKAYVRNGLRTERCRERGGCAGFGVEIYVDANQATCTIDFSMAASAP